MPKLMIRGGDLDLVEYELQPFLPGNQMNTLGFEKKKYHLKPVKGTVAVTAPARIHLTVLDMNRLARGNPGVGVWDSRCRCTAPPRSPAPKKR